MKKFKDLPAGAVFRLHDEMEQGINRQYYKYRFNKDFNAEIFGIYTPVKIDSEALISKNYFL